MQKLKLASPKAALQNMLQAAVKYIALHKSYFGTYDYQVSIIQSFHTQIQWLRLYLRWSVVAGIISFKFYLLQSGNLSLTAVHSFAQ